MTTLHPDSALQPPPQYLLQRFKLSMIGDDTVRTFLTKGYSLAICCRECKRLTEWTPPEIEERFGSRLELRIAAIASRLLCKGEGGCGSHDIAVFPHLYDLPWKWTDPDDDG